MKITISGLSGVGSSSTAKLVSQQLNLPMTNFTFRALAAEKGIEWTELQKQAATDPEIDFELDRRLIGFINSHESCIAATDVASWLDNPGVYTKLGLEGGADIDYKIWLEAPLEVRAARMHQREGGDLAEIVRYNHQRDMDNRERYLHLYGIDIFEHGEFDWVLETSEMSLEEVVEAVTKRLGELGVA